MDRRRGINPKNNSAPLVKDIVAYDLDTGTEKVLELPGNQENSHVSGDFVSFNNSASGVPHIGLWQISTGANFAVTSGAGYQLLNDIDGNRIVYSDNRSGNLDIYLYTFTILDMKPPVANAGQDQSVRPETVVTLDGSGSDPDGDQITYSWQMLSKPPGSAAALTGADTRAPSFTADAEGDYSLSLVVTDTTGLSSAADEVVVSTCNTPPSADAGPDQAITAINTTVQRDPPAPGALGCPQSARAEREILPRIPMGWRLGRMT